MALPAWSSFAQISSRDRFLVVGDTTSMPPLLFVGDTTSMRACVRVIVRACVRAHKRACVRACMRAAFRWRCAFDAAQPAHQWTLRKQSPALRRRCCRCCATRARRHLRLAAAVQRSVAADARHRRRPIGGTLAEQHSVAADARHRVALANRQLSLGCWLMAANVRQRAATGNVDRPIGWAYVTQTKLKCIPSPRTVVHIVGTALIVVEPT